MKDNSQEEDSYCRPERSQPPTASPSLTYWSWVNWGHCILVHALWMCCSVRYLRKSTLKYVFFFFFSNTLWHYSLHVWMNRRLYTLHIMCNTAILWTNVITAPKRLLHTRLSSTAFLWYNPRTTVTSATEEWVVRLNDPLGFSRSYFSYWSLLNLINSIYDH